MIIAKQIKALQGFGEEFLEASKAAAKGDDKERYLAMALKSFDKVRELTEARRASSLAYYFEFLAWTSPRPCTYEAYLDFCFRNEFERLSQEDFEAYLLAIKVEGAEKA